MHVCEHLAIATHEDRVSGHAHIELEVAGGLAVLILHAKGEYREPLGEEWRVIFDPDDLSCRRLALAPRAIVTGERRALNAIARYLPRDGLRDTRSVYEISEELVVAGGHVG